MAGEAVCGQLEGPPLETHLYVPPVASPGPLRDVQHVQPLLSLDESRTEVRGGEELVHRRGGGGALTTWEPSRAGDGHGIRIDSWDTIHSYTTSGTHRHMKSLDITTNRAPSSLV
ncbi:unnamed protein product [Danaus chrysippus]|uniref:(African queen) hypothetical protein n=1 Tax=Danaus chrysippus TaxID=151541 RepID=A0A8J2VQW2_9NEOP|nr:unnamed protein product [Danaus chrysippus]